jgi:hypothetical protein
MQVVNTERGKEGETLLSGVDSFVVGDDLLDSCAVEIKANYKELSVSPTDKAPDVQGGVLIFDDTGELIGRVAHVGWAQNGGITVENLDRVIFQQYPRK